MWGDGGELNDNFDGKDTKNSSNFQTFIFFFLFPSSLQKMFLSLPQPLQSYF